MNIIDLMKEEKAEAPEYNKEAGVVVSDQINALMYVEGETGHVTFPSEAIWEIHKKSPGTVLGFIHTHPIGMANASALDMHMLETWAKVLYPFPARLSVITLIPNPLAPTRPSYSEKIYYARWQDKEEWAKDKTQERRVDIRIERTEVFMDGLFPWREWLLDFSYKKKNA